MGDLSDLLKYAADNKGQIALLIVAAVYLARSNAKLAGVIQDSINARIGTLELTMTRVLTSIKEFAEQLLKGTQKMATLQADLMRTNGSVSDLRDELKHAASRHDTYVVRDNERKAQLDHTQALLERNLACTKLLLTHYKVSVPADPLKPYEVEDVGGGQATRLKKTGTDPGENKGGSSP